MTLNGVKALILRYFTEFSSFRGVLRTRSRSLSHLLMSSCKYMPIPRKTTFDSLSVCVSKQDVLKITDSCVD